MLRESLPDHWMKNFFLANIMLEFQQNEESIQIYNQLSNYFPESNYIVSQKAIANYNLRGI